jgi:hypothetical protein
MYEADMVRLTPPTPVTLKKYGLTQDLWYNMLSSQGGICPICEQEFTEESRPVIDHFHVPRFKKMKDFQKRKYVRGLLHNYCNRRMIPNGMTSKKAHNLYLYLRKFEVKLASDNP